MNLNTICALILSLLLSIRDQLRKSHPSGFGLPTAQSRQAVLASRDFGV